MKQGDIHKELEESVCWANAPPAPTPGMCYIEPQIKRDFTSFDGSLEKVIPRQLHTDLLDAMDIDFMKMVMDHIEALDTPGPEDPRDRHAMPRDQEKRGEVLERERIKKSMSRIFDYQKYIQESFEDVNTIIHPLDERIRVEEVYDLFPGPGGSDVIVQSDGIDFQKTSFSISEEESSRLFRKATMDDGRALTCSPQRVDNLLVFHVKNGHAYYSSISTLYRLQEYRKQKKGKEEK
ncbi:hypothetical protein M970_070620 [Encephalitozoon cuniculi EcunIII-L]|uniref:Uncharacterized protein n=1 Tax=Encephalitozoon cuniculi TaxID=6035 RepID=M1K9L6_ENCCN|nr:hypothetical protein ECU07_0670 [Encephalitozoon cuniculi]KMV65791.1 hypothetical protein M970_070620 [Encephalitozoon cuniculi EcunIII-L]UYI27225.1 hypothetical protein J0A71_05g10820 [Encephalitozoon cuniculi]